MGCQAQISESKLKILLSCSDSYSYGRKLFYTIADERGCTNSARLLIKKVSKRRIKPKPKIQLVNVRDRKLFKSWLSRTYGGDAEDIANSLFGTLDGGYYVASLTASINGDIGSNSGKKDAWLIKLNNKGDIDYKQTNAKDFWVLKFNETNQSQEFI